MAPHAEFDPDWEPEPETAPHAEFDPDREPRVTWKRPLQALCTPGRMAGSDRRRSPVFMATAILACAFLLVVGIAAIATLAPPRDDTAGCAACQHGAARGARRRQRRPGSSRPPTRWTPPRPPPRAGLASVTGFPTPANVANRHQPDTSRRSSSMTRSCPGLPCRRRPARPPPPPWPRCEATSRSSAPSTVCPRSASAPTSRRSRTDVSRLQATLSTLEQALHG